MKQDKVPGYFFLVIVILLMTCNDAFAQRIDVKGVRKKSKAADCATIVFKSDFDILSVKGTSQDSVYKTKGCDYNNIWTYFYGRRCDIRTPYSV